MGNAGTIDFPAHMKTVHQDWLDQTGTDTITNSMVDVMKVAQATNPYTGLAGLDPSSELSAMDLAITAFNTRVDALDPDGDWEDAVNSAKDKADGAVFDDTYITADINAMADVLDDQITNIVLPRFKSGLRDVNAVMTSAFVIGQSIIEGMRDRDVAKYGTDLRVKFNFQRNDFILKGVEMILKELVGQVEMEKSVAHYTLEANRLRIVAEKEQLDTDNAIEIDKATWDLRTFQYGANLLAAIGGGTMIPDNDSGSSTSKTQSALGGALAGAAVGGSVAGGWSSAVGALLGGVGGLL